MVSLSRKRGTIKTKQRMEKSFWKILLGASFLSFVAITSVVFVNLHYKYNVGSTVDIDAKNPIQNMKTTSKIQEPHIEEESISQPVTTAASDDLDWYEKSQPLITEWPKLETRNDVHPILEKLKLKYGIEVGVKNGLLAKRTLKSWKSCEEYKLVDLWGSEDGYQEPNARAKSEQEKYLRETRRRVQPWTDKSVIEFFIMRSSEAAKKFKDEYFDFIYLDARHDYCAVVEDIADYYPKLRPGGILGGHDYVDSQYAIDKLGPHEDWSKCEDGSNHPEAVKGAVDEFVKQHGLSIITSHEGFPSWYVQKPY